MLFSQQSVLSEPEAEMPTCCTACRAENLEGSETCFTCGVPLVASHTSRPLTQGSVVSGRYKLVSPLGRGGMGVVYRAFDEMLEEDVALKLLRPDVAASRDFARRFRSEIKLARRVTHRNVCRIHEYGIDSELHYISMELCEGVDLKRVVRETGPLAPAAAVDAMIQACKGLQAIHDAGVIHRDIKTSNLMRDQAGVVKLMDFGIAKQASVGADVSGATQTGQIIGTPEYMSPEQARGEKLDVRSDLYSLGVVLYELVTGAVPFKADTPIGVILKHLHDAPSFSGPAFERLPAALRPLLRKALEKNPADRFSSAAEFASALGTFHPSAPTAVYPESVQPTLEVTSARVPAAAPGSPALPAPPAARARGARPDGGRPVAPAMAQPRLMLVVALIAVLGSAVLLVSVGAMLLRWRFEEPGTARVAAGGSDTPAGADVPAAPVVVEEASSPPNLAGPTPNAAQPPPTRSDQPPNTPHAASPRPAPTPAQPPPYASEPAQQPSAPPAKRVEPSPAPLPPASVPAPPAKRVEPSPAPLPPASATTPATKESPRRRLEWQTPPSVAPSGAAAAPVQAGFGTLQLRILPWAEVFVDGASLGTTPMKPLELAPGQHAIRFVHPDYQDVQRKVTIVAGAVARIELDLALDALARAK